MHRRGTGHPRTRFADRLHHDGGFGDPETRAAVLLRDTNSQPTVFRERLMQFHWKAAIAVLFQPILIIELFANLTDRFANRLLLFRK